MNTIAWVAAAAAVWYFLLRGKNGGITLAADAGKLSVSTDHGMFGPNPTARTVENPGGTQSPWVNLSMRGTVAPVVTTLQPVYGGKK